MKDYKIQMLLLTFIINSSYYLFFLLDSKHFELNVITFGIMLFLIFSLEELYFYSRRTSSEEKEQEAIINKKNEIVDG